MHHLGFAEAGSIAEHEFAALRSVVARNPEAEPAAQHEVTPYQASPEGRVRRT